MIRHADGTVEERLLSDGAYTIGRDGGDIPLHDPNVSSRHAILEIAGERAVIRDLGSRNGTRNARGERLTSDYSVRGDEPLHIGKSTIRLVCEPASGTREMTLPEGQSSGSATMTSVVHALFISHVAEDAVPALKLAFLLEHAGFASRCYEVDSIAGISHLKQTMEAIARADAVLLLISPESLRSHEVTTELTRALDLGKTIIPLLHRISHQELMSKRAEWGQRLASSACLDVTDWRRASGVC